MSTMLSIKVLRAAVLCALASLTAWPAVAGTLQAVPGNAVFVNANALDANRVVVLRRSASGKLSRLAAYPTRGKGSGVGELIPRDPLGSQNALLLSEDGRWLFVVNPGSNQVSTFRVIDDFLLLTSVVGSGGAFPTSIALRGDTLYVMNAGGASNVVGFRLDRYGQLRRIAGSTRALLTVTDQLGRQPNPTNSPAQVQFSPDGKFLVVADKNLSNPPGLLQVFQVRPDGSLSAHPVATPTTGPAPFGFTFDRNGHLFVTEVVQSTVTSYRLNEDGTASTITETPTGSGGTCWVDIAGSFLYVSNTDHNDLSVLKTARDGRLTVLEPITGQGQEPIDVSVSGDGRWLHTLSSSAGTVRTFRIDAATGAITLTDELHLFEPLSGAAGLAAE